MSILDLVWYDSGMLRWKSAPRRGVAANSIVGHPTGNYLRFAYSGKSYAVHRVIWEMHNGPIPEGMQIDHIDNNTMNNRLDNLRLATHSQNNMNKVARCDNALGIKGVFKRFRAGRYEYVGRVTRDRKVHTKVSVDLTTVVNFVNSMRISLHGDFAQGVHH